jgi:SAM-dependent methyltransferase
MRYDDLAELYDAENEHHAMLQEDVPFFLGQLPKRRQSVLELACGTGRAAIPIAQAGHRVVGVDFDPAMIAIAQRKASFVGLAKRELDLRVGDALRVNLRQKFDWVCILFNTFLSFSTLEQQDACLEVVKRHLKPNARLFMDILQPNVGLLAQEKSRDLDPHLFFAPTLGTNVLKTIDVERDPSKQLEKVTFRYRWHDRNGRPRPNQRTMKFNMTFVFPRELQLLLERHGMQVEAMWGNYDGSVLDADSPRMIVRARRAAGR